MAVWKARFLFQLNGFALDLPLENISAVDDGSPHYREVTYADRFLECGLPLGLGLMLVTSRRSTISIVSSFNPTPMVRPEGVIANNSG
ncbi:MAG: hypothetical protein ABSH08_13865 [Tepidisphaeraceae bacterium]